MPISRPPNARIDSHRQVQESVRSARMRPQGSRPPLRYCMRARGEAVGGADPRQARPGQVDKPEGSERLDERERALRELTRANGVDPWVAAERLDERAVEGLGRVEH